MDPKDYRTDRRVRIRSQIPGTFPDLDGPLIFIVPADLELLD